MTHTHVGYIRRPRCWDGCYRYYPWQMACTGPSYDAVIKHLRFEYPSDSFSLLVVPVGTPEPYGVQERRVTE